jgi:hypothetical protein
VSNISTPVASKIQYYNEEKKKKQVAPENSEATAEPTEVRRSPRLRKK